MPNAKNSESPGWRECRCVLTLPPGYFLTIRSMKPGFAGKSSVRNSAAYARDWRTYRDYRLVYMVGWLVSDFLLAMIMSRRTLE